MPTIVVLLYMIIGIPPLPWPTQTKGRHCPLPISTTFFLANDSDVNSGIILAEHKSEASYLARLFHELLRRDREDGRASGQPSRITAGLDPSRT